MITLWLIYMNRCHTAIAVRYVYCHCHNRNMAATLRDMVCNLKAWMVVSMFKDQEGVIGLQWRMVMVMAMVHILVL